MTKCKKALCSVLQQGNPLGNPVGLLNRGGGEFDGNDKVQQSVAVPAGMRFYKGSVIYRHERPSSANITTLFSIQSTSSGGIWAHFDASSNTFKFRIRSGSNCYTPSMALIVGQTYNIVWDLDLADATLGGTVVINGISLDLGSKSVEASSGSYFVIGNAAFSGTGKVSYLNSVIDGAYYPTYAPAVYGIYGTTNCGNSWVLTDGSPTTFWSDFGQDFGLLAQPGGNCSGIDDVSNAPLSPFLTSSGSITFSIGSLFTGYPSIYRASRTGFAEVFFYGADGSSTAILSIGSGTNRITGNVGLSLNSAYTISWSASHIDGSLSCTATVNGIPITFGGPGAWSQPGNIHKVTGSGVAVSAKVAKVVASFDGVPAPEYNPSTYGVNGTSDCGNGWVLTDGSPTTFWT